MRGYTQLTRDERYQIYALRKAGHSQKEIAEVLRRNPSTISRELGRNMGLKGYRPEQAHRLAQNRKKERDRTRIPESTWARVEQLLREDWSPEQISGWLTREEGVSVSHERIYQHVYEDKRGGGDLHRHLRCQKPRRKRYGHYDRRCPPWRAKRRRVVPGSREATRDTRRAEGAKGDPKGASERDVQSYGRPVCSRNELAMLWRNAG